MVSGCALLVVHGALAVVATKLLTENPALLVAIGADRRGPAQRCGQELLEALKHDAPFWKREWHADGRGTWLTGNTPL